MEIRIRPSRVADGNRAIDIWRGAVDATHDFLAPIDRVEIDTLVQAFLPSAPLLLAVDALDWPIGFMLLDQGHIEALFIDALHRGTGVGKALVMHGLAIHSVLKTDVNEQNGQAVGFYRHMGFRQTGRSPFDRDGRPYPLLHMMFD